MKTSTLARLGLPILVTFGNIFFSPSSWALSLVRQATLAQARNGVPITVWDGGGTNIDFSHTSEIIQKVWLDDPSKLTLDFDGNLCSGGNCNGSDTGAGILHLRRVVGVRFPNVPSTPTTMLSVVTVSPTGTHNLYQFQISYGHGSPQYTTLSMESDAATQGSGAILTTDGRSVDLQAVDRGLQQAIATHLITSSSPVIPRVQAFVSSVSSGTSVQQAIAQSNISMELVSRLAEMGSPSYGSLTATSSDPAAPSSDSLATSSPTPDVSSTNSSSPTASTP